MGIQRYLGESGRASWTRHLLSCHLSGGGERCSRRVENPQRALHQEEACWAQGMQKRGDARKVLGGHIEDLVSVLKGHCQLLCYLRQVTAPLCALVSSSVKQKG